ncbi:hypothetical protein [Pendulispora albinea]|uniref:Uncharacterized protein n=1 Tax=Pendulispora albinea TaxID=2741071 RepID=A0ABZ2M9K1_9BACT
MIASRFSLACSFGLALALPACGGKNRDHGQGGAGLDTTTGLETLGIINITHVPSTPAGTSFYVVQAAFSDHYESTSDVECTYREEAHCTIQACTDNRTAPFRAKPAGKLTIGGGLFGTPGIEVEPDSDHAYVDVGSIKPWEPGQMLIARGGGDEIPSFEVSVPAPGTFTLMAPAIPPEDALPISRSAPLPLQWSAEPLDRVVIITSSEKTSNANPLVTATCRFAASETSGGIPASVLAVLPPGPATFDAAVTNIGVSQVANRAVLFVATELAHAAGGGPAHASARVE